MDPRCPVLRQDADSLAWPLSLAIRAGVQAFLRDHHLIYPFPVGATRALLSLTLTATVYSPLWEKK